MWGPLRSSARSVNGSGLKGVERIPIWVIECVDALSLPRRRRPCGRFLAISSSRISRRGTISRRPNRFRWSSSKMARGFPPDAVGPAPAWVKDPRKITLLINARTETVLEKPAFKNAMRRRRCLIPADGYYEWQAVRHSQAAPLHSPPRWQPFGLAGLAEPGPVPMARSSTPSRSSPRRPAPISPCCITACPLRSMPADFDRWLDCSERRCRRR